MDNRRSDVRYSISLSGEIHVGQEMLLAQAKNLSLGGVGFEMDAPLTVGTHVKLSLFLVEDGIEEERAKPLAAEGVVSWCAEQQGAGYGAGVRFLAMEQSMQERLRQTIRLLSRQTGGA